MSRIDRQTYLFIGVTTLTITACDDVCGELVDGALCPDPPPGGQIAATHRLEGWAALPQSTRTPGPTSGNFIGPNLGVTPPFAGEQPVPGWSGLLNNGDGSLLALPDNGYGAKGNSADFVLGTYQVTPTFKVATDGTTSPGPVVNDSFTAFNDANLILRNGEGVDLIITADLDSYRSGSGLGANSGVPVDPAIIDGRMLTGYDFDVESIARAPDGTLWVGEEFGPFLLHFDVNGTLLEEPVPHPFLVSPNHPAALAIPGTNNLAGSRGFESLAFDHEDSLLYVVPEAAPLDDALRPVPGNEQVLEFFEFDPSTSQYTGVTYQYRKDGDPIGNAIVIGDMTNVGPDRYVLIERDSAFGPAAEVKRLYIVDLNVTDGDGVLRKRLLVDLLDIDDPDDIGGPLLGLDPLKFSMPFDSIECVVVFDAWTLGVAIDTNFPTEDGRESGVPDSTEFIKLKFEAPVASLAPTTDS